MERKEVEVYSEVSNYGIVRMPGRNFPGAVVQGDSLSILCNQARRIVQHAENGTDTELIEEAKELLDLLEDRLSHYEQVLAEHQIPLPYNKQNAQPNKE